MSKSTRSGFNECKSVRCKGLERASHSRGQKFDQQSQKDVNKSLKACGPSRSASFKHEVPKW